MALQESFELSDGTGTSTYGTTWGMQTFTTESAYTIDEVALYCFKYGSPGDITVSIREVDVGTGKPIGIDKCSVTVDESEISAFPTRAWYTFTFDTTYALSDATKYAIVWRAPSGSAANYFAPFGYGSSGYADGDLATSTNSGSIWSALSTTNDMDFRTYGEVSEIPINPTPEHEDTEVDWSDLTLSWEDGGGADDYDVWVGDAENLHLISEEQAETSYVVPYTTEEDEEGVMHAYVDGNEINWNTVIYWEIDAISGGETTEGDIWNFDPRPGAITTPTPAHEATDITLNKTLTWEAPGGVIDSYDLYLGTESESLVLVNEGITPDWPYIEAKFDYYNLIYYWLLDTVNDFGIARSDEFYFTTLLFYPPLPTGVTLDYSGDSDDEDFGEPTGTPTGLNNMITIRKLVAAANNLIWIEDI